MKSKIHVLFLFIIVLFLMACDKKDTDMSLNKESIDFVFKAEMETESWIGTKNSSYFDKRSNEYFLFVSNQDSFYLQEESFKISIDKSKILIGAKLRDFDATLASIIGGDCIAWRYEKTENAEESYVIINEIDTVSKRLSGEFEIKLKDARSTEDYYMNFIDGEFELHYMYY